MRRFNYRLDRLREIKRYHEREWELKLAKATGACLLLEQRIAANRKQRQGWITVSHTTDLHSFLSRQLYIQRLDQEVVRLHKDLHRQQEVREQIRKSYLESAKERKVLDKLRERKAKDYIRDQKQEEIKNLNEISDGRSSRLY